MSTELSPERTIYLEIALLGVILSAIAYGVVVTLFICCINALLQPSSVRNCSSTMTRFLLFYSGVLLVFSTWALVQNTFAIMSAIFHNFDNSGKSVTCLHLTESNPLFLPITVWTADGFLGWRCVVLYWGISGRRRIALYVGLTSLCLMSLVSGLFTLLPPPIALGPGPIVFISVSGVINVILSALIIVRLYSHKKSAQKSLGIYQGQFYKRIMVMLTESCALIVVFTILYIVLFFTSKHNGKAVPLFLLPQVCVISPLLIVYRVARRRAAPESYSDTRRWSITSVSPDPFITFSAESSPTEDASKNYIWHHHGPGSIHGSNDT